MRNTTSNTHTHIPTEEYACLIIPSFYLAFLLFFTSPYSLLFRFVFYFSAVSENVNPTGAGFAQQRGFHVQGRPVRPLIPARIIPSTGFLPAIMPSCFPSLGRDVDDDVANDEYACSFPRSIIRLPRAGLLGGCFPDFKRFVTFFLPHPKQLHTLPATQLKALEI